MPALLIWLYLFLVSIVNGATNASGIDPVDNYCLRLKHQSTVKSGRLYIDGGLEIFVEWEDHERANGTRIIGYNTNVIEIDMTSSWDWKQNISIRAIPKKSSPKINADPPVVVRGALYSGTSSDLSIYQYGGAVSYANTSFPGVQRPTSSQYALWSYNTSQQTWDRYDVTMGIEYRPAGGAYAEAPDQGLAFYLNGYINNGTSSDLEQWDNFRRYLDGLIVIDTHSQMATNISTSSLANFPRVKGGMVYIPGIGPKGILIAIGGVTKPTSDDSASNEGTHVPFQEIDIFDISSVFEGDDDGIWYTQKASGDIPDGRTDFCLVSVSAKDNSSHNIYMYGGTGTDGTYDQIYVLTIPSFTWTKIYEGKSPRYGHTCHLVGNRQMVSVGGASSDNFSICDWEYRGVAIYDLSTLTWGSVYNALAPEYEVPAAIHRVIGGGPKGNASKKAPVDGFDMPQVAGFFNALPNNDSTNGSEPTDKQLTGGSIAGIVVGSVVGAALLSAGLYLMHQRKLVADRARRVAAEEEKKSDIFANAVWMTRHEQREAATLADEAVLREANAGRI